MLGISIWISFENIKSLLVFFFLFLFIQSYIYWAWTFLLRGGLLRNIVNCKSRMNGGNGERDGVVSSAVKYHVLLSRLVLANVLGKFKPSVSCFLALMLASLLAHLLISARRPSVFECFCFGFFFFSKGGWCTDFFVNNNSCHWLPCPWLLLPWFLSDKSHIVPHILALFLADIGPLLRFFFFFSPPHRPFVSLSRSDWGIIAKLNTFRAIAHFLSFPPCDVRTFQRAFPQGLLTSCLSHACDWLTLCFIGLNLHALHLRCNNLPFIIRPFF